MDVRAILSIILVIISAGILVISMLMSPDSNGFSGALVGSGDLELFKTSKERVIQESSQMIDGFLRAYPLNTFDCLLSFS
nr:hypothetical protein [Mycoplasmopsis bovis]